MAEPLAHAALTSALVAKIKAFQDAVDRFDAAAAARVGVNETDLRCLAYLSDAGPCRPSTLANVLGLTRGAMTTALGRLEQAGHIVRSADATDARSHLVELSRSAAATLERIWAPIRAQGATHLAGYTDAQLRLLTTFMERSVRLHDQCRHELSGATPGMTAGFIPEQDRA